MVALVRQEFTSMVIVVGSKKLERKGPLQTEVKVFDITVAWMVISSGYHYYRSRLGGACVYEAWKG